MFNSYDLHFVQKGNDAFILVYHLHNIITYVEYLAPIQPSLHFRSANLQWSPWTSRIYHSVQLPCDVLWYFEIVSRNYGYRGLYNFI